MTERIKELERQAEKFVMGIPASLDINEYTSVFNAKFAELIIHDVIKIMSNPANYNRCTYTTFDLSQGQCVAQELTTQINEHFGTKL